MWSILFAVAVGQGLFFLALLLFSKRYRSRTSGYLCLLLLLFLITDLDYYFIASGNYKVFPWLFGISNGLILLMGPTLLLYSRSLLSGAAFRLKEFLHFIPYAIFFVLSIPIFTLSSSDKIFFIDAFVSGSLPLRAVDYIIFTVQILHLFFYLVRMTRVFKVHRAIGTHESWVRSLLIFLFGYGLLVLLLAIVIFSMGRFSLNANYSYSLACSALLYFVTGFALLNPGISFEERRKNRKPLDNIEVDACWRKLLLVMEKDKVFVKADIRLQDVAQMIGLTPHQLSQLINERSGKNFSDFLNHYRIEEFKLRIIQRESSQLTLVGLAMEIGFNSKTSFNNTFKKITGQTPSEYKRSLL
jgi:AraC-like DNA-binding protein